MEAIITSEAEGGTPLDADQLFLQSKALMAVDRLIMITDVDARILYVNEAFTTFTGYRPEEVLGRTPKILKSGEHDPNFYRQFWQTVLGGQTWRGKFVNRRQDGTICVHLQTTTPVRRVSGGPITHFVSVSEELPLSEKDRANSPDVRSMQAVSQVAAGIAHHINNSLTVIHCNSEILLSQNGALDPNSRTLIEQTLAASVRAANVVRQLVACSQGGVQDFRPVDLNRLLEETVPLLVSKVGDRISWEARCQNRLPIIIGDGGMLNQMISHLVLNALDAMPNRGKIILTTEQATLSAPELSNHNSAHPGDFVCFSITDTGCGIASTDLPHIFEPFFTTKDSVDRSGLGLALVYGIVKQHHGWIEVHSDLGLGTTFKVFLPAVVRAEPTTSAHPSRPTSENHLFGYPASSPQAPLKKVDKLNL